MHTVLMALLLPFTTPSGQSPMVQVELAADHDGVGPAGLRWLRTRGLPALAPQMEQIPLLGQLQLTVMDDGSLAVARASGATADDVAYGSFTVQLMGVSGKGTIDRDGIEDWTLEGALPPHHRLHTLLQLLDLHRDLGPRTLDVAALVGNLAPGLPNGDPLRAMLFQGAAECGEVTFKAWAEGSTWRVRARGAGGLLLPAVLTLLADLKSHPDAGLSSRPIGDNEPQALLARVARDDSRDEAIRQLGRKPDARSREALYGLLHGNGNERIFAMEALVRAAVPEALPRLLAAATPEQPETELLAQLALWSLLPAAKDRAKSEVFATLRGHQSVTLRNFEQDYLRATARTAGIGRPQGADGSITAGSGSTRHYGLLASALLSLVLALVLLRSRGSP